MMPWYTMLGLFAVASPIMALAGVLRGPGLAGVFLLGAVGYFLCYETLHALYHLPDATLDRAGIGRLRAFRRLQAHHRHHHILGRMAAVNFNVTVPPDGPPVRLCNSLSRFDAREMGPERATSSRGRASRPRSGCRPSSTRSR